MPINLENYTPKHNDLLCPVAIIPDLIPSEYFALINPNVFPDIIPYYMISNYGRIWNKYQNHFLRPGWDIKDFGYRVVSLTHKDGTSSTYKIHRLLMLTHRYFPGCESLVINHKDGIKTHNYIDCPFTKDKDNLEWCNMSYNEKEAFRLGLKTAKYGENHPLSTLTEDTVVKLCQILEDKLNGKCSLTLKEIAKLLHVTENQINYIKNRNGWKYIKEKYNF